MIYHINYTIIAVIGSLVPHPCSGQLARERALEYGVQWLYAGTTV